MTFKSGLKAFAGKTQAQLDETARKVVIDLGRRLVQKSPVGDPDNWDTEFHGVLLRLGWVQEDYVGGRFRANWQHGFNSPAKGDLPDIDKTGAVSIDRIIKGVENSPASGIHYISNNLPYAMRLENGYSKQAPRGMVELTAIEFSGIVKTEFRKAAK